MARRGDEGDRSVRFWYVTEAEVAATQPDNAIFVNDIWIYFWAGLIFPP